MKNYFFTGLAVLLPVAITIFLVVTLFNLLTEPFAGIARDILSRYHNLDHIPEKLLHLLSQVIILILLFSTTILLGLFGRWLFVDYAIRLSERLVERIPFISSLYNMSKDVIKTLFASSNSSFKQVVLVPYPNAETHCMGLVTRNDMEGLGSHNDPDLLAVFVPCTPNPTSGFLMMFKRNEIIFLDMKVDDAFKYIISCGVVNVPMNIQKSGEV
jgi:uncharacterized membrane protein